jgi:hypothetical protein
MEQGNAGGAVGVVFDGGHLGRDLQLVALEIDEPVAPLVSPTPVADGDPAVISSGPPTFSGDPDQAFFRLTPGDLGKIRRCLEPPPREVGFQAVGLKL